MIERKKKTMLVSSMDHLNYYSLSNQKEAVANGPYLDMRPVPPSSGPGGSNNNNNNNEMNSAPVQIPQYHLQPPSTGPKPSNNIVVEETPTGSTNSSYVNNDSSPKNSTKSSLYKTELCKRYSEFGNCRYGAKCQFAHGIGELRHVVRHPKYKTTKCKSYWGTGRCPYGSRCRFVHEEIELLSNPQYASSMKNSYGNETEINPHRVSPPKEAGSHGNNNYLYMDHHSPSNDVLIRTGSEPTFNLNSSSWMARSPEVDSTNLLNHNNNNNNMSKNSGSETKPRAPSYPDLQNAIEALMKFSLNTPEYESNIGTIKSNPQESTSVENLSKSPDYSLGSDELWKDFPQIKTSDDELNLSEPSGGASSSSSQLQWPSSSGLGLDLNNTPLESSGESSNPAAASKSSNGGSPRLSVFEKFT